MGTSPASTPGGSQKPLPLIDTTSRGSIAKLAPSQTDASPQVSPLTSWTSFPYFAVRRSTGFRDSRFPSFGAIEAIAYNDTPLTRCLVLYAGPTLVPTHAG